MSLLAPLLDIQELDLTADAARARSNELAEREVLPRLEADLVGIDLRLAAAQAEQAQMQAEEERLGVEVSQVARDIETAEVKRYSGKRMDRDEAKTHEESQKLLREKQESLEEQEMELLESIEAVENRVEAERSNRSANRAQTEQVLEIIQKVESEVAAELLHLDEARLDITARVSPEVLAAYDRVRAQPRAAGRGATTLTDGRCGACRIKLPSHEKTKMLALPDDAVIQCPQCRRLLVR
jgi:uncharacterized protein